VRQSTANGPRSTVDPGLPKICCEQPTLVEFQIAVVC
jgi:hypothetical protein